MPYVSNDQLPPAVQSRYSARCQSVFRRVFNEHDGDEASRFKVAHTAARNCMNAKALLPVKAASLDPDEMRAWFDGKHSRRLLAIPFGGPILHPKAPRGVDLDGEWFSERTDIYGSYKALRETPERRLDWHHGNDRLMKRTPIGKSILDPDPDEDGWWVETWLAAGSKHLAMVRRLVERGAQLFGSSEAASKSVDPETGEIRQWPMILETLTLAPINTLSVLAPIKAADTTDSVGLPQSITALLADLDALSSNLSATSEAGEQTAKAERVVSNFVAAVQRVDEAHR